MIFCDELSLVTVAFLANRGSSLNLPAAVILKLLRHGTDTDHPGVLSNPGRYALCWCAAITSCDHYLEFESYAAVLQARARMEASRGRWFAVEGWVSSCFVWVDLVDVVVLVPTRCSQWF